MHPTIITTVDETARTLCPDATITTSTISSSTIPSDEPSCYPTHGPPHDDPEQDQVVKLCAFKDQQLLELCRSDKATEEDPPTIHGDPLLHCQASGEGPTRWNFYATRYVRKSNGTKQCAMLYRDTLPDNIETNDVLSALCVDPYKKIIDKCPWNGGVLETDCGIFRLQSCPYGQPCKTGEPQGYDLDK